MFLILLVNPNFPMSMRNNSLNILGHYPRSVFFKSILQVKVALIFENKHNFGKIWGNKFKEGGRGPKL